MAIEQKFGQNDDNNDNKSTFGGNASVSGGTGQTQPAQQSRQGSGLFTDLTKYINANKGAGQRTAGNIGQNLGQQFEPAKTNVFNTSQKTQQDVSSGQQELQKGSQFKTLFDQNKPDVEAFASDDKKAAEFAKFRTGQGVDVNQLQGSANQFQQANIAAQQRLQDFNKAVGSEQGRFGLLKDTYGGIGKRYGSGQQKLDQLLLQTGGDNAVGALKGTVGGLEQSVNPEMAKLADYQQAIGKVNTDQAALSQDLTKLSSEAFGQKAKELSDQMGTINAARIADRTKAENAYGSLLGREGAADLNQDVANLVNLRLGQGLYGALDNINTINDIADIDARDASDIGQTSSQEQLNRYNALQKLSKAGYDKNKGLVYDNALNKALHNQLTDKAVSYKDLGALASKGEEDFIKALYSGEGDIVGYGTTAHAGASQGQSVSDYLTGGRGIEYANTSGTINNYGFRPVDTTPGAVYSGRQVLQDNPGYGATPIDVLTFSGNKGVDSQEYTDAEAYANADWHNQMKGFLDKYKASSVLGERGKKSDQYDPNARFSGLKNKYNIV